MRLRSQTPLKRARKKTSLAISTPPKTLLGASVDLLIEMAPIDAVRHRTRNPRIHTGAQIGRIMESVRTFGMVLPLLVDKDGVLIHGAAVYDAARGLGFAHVPVIRVTHLNPIQIKGLAIALNRLAELSSWDEEILAAEFGDLLQDETFDVTWTGFEAATIDALVFGDDFGDPDPADKVLPFPPAQDAISVVGDLWIIGDLLRLACGDALLPETYALALQGRKADQVLTDPPYNVPIDGHVSGKGKARHREFAMAVGEMSEAAFIAFLTTVLQRLKENAHNGALVFSFMDGAHLFELLSAARAAGLVQKTICTWAKTNAGMGGLYRNQTEHIGVFKVGEAPSRNNVELGRHGRHRTTLWSYPGMNAFGRGRDAALALHPTVKPVGLLADAILDASPRGGVVLDPFAGSASTLIAAHRTGRVGVGIELDPLYVDAALARLYAVTGIEPVRASDGARWSALVAARAVTGVAS